MAQEVYLYSSEINRLDWLIDYIRSIDSSNHDTTRNTVLLCTNDTEEFNWKIHLNYIRQKLQFYGFTTKKSNHILSVCRTLFDILSMSTGQAPSSYSNILNIPLFRKLSVDSKCKDITPLTIYKLIYSSTEREKHTKNCNACFVNYLLNGIRMIKAVSSYSVRDSCIFALRWFEYDRLTAILPESKLVKATYFAFKKSLLKLAKQLDNLAELIEEGNGLLLYDDSIFVGAGCEVKIDGKRQDNSNVPNPDYKILLSDEKIIINSKPLFSVNKLIDPPHISSNSMLSSLICMFTVKSMFTVTSRSTYDKINRVIENILSNNGKARYSKKNTLLLEFKKVKFDIGAYSEDKILLIDGADTQFHRFWIFLKRVLNALMMPLLSAHNNYSTSKKLNTFDPSISVQIRIVPSISKYLLICPYRYFLSMNNYRYKEKTTLALFGTIVHATINKYVAGEISNLEQFLSTVKSNVGERIYFAQWNSLVFRLSQVAQALLDYLDSRRKMRVIYEKRFQKSIVVEGVLFHISSIVDLLTEDVADIDIVEFKLTNKKFTKYQVDQNLQLTLYRWVVNKCLGVQNRGAIFDIFNCSEIYQTADHQIVEAITVKFLRNVADTLRKDNFTYLPKINNGCYTCNFTQFCPRYSGRTRFRY